MAPWGQVTLSFTEAVLFRIKDRMEGPELRAAMGHEFQQGARNGGHRFGGDSCPPTTLGGSGEFVLRWAPHPANS